MLSNNGDDASLKSSLSAKAEATLQIKSLLNRGRKFGRRVDKSFQSTTSDANSDGVFPSPALPLSEDPMEVDHSVRDDNSSKFSDRMNRIRQKLPLHKMNVFAGIDTKSKSGAGNRSQRTRTLFWTKSVFSPVKSKGKRKSQPYRRQSPSVESDSNRPERRMSKQISFNLDNLQGSDLHRDDRRKNQFAANKRRSWLKKLKKPKTRNKRRSSEPILNGNGSMCLSEATDRVDHRRRLSKQISFNLENLEASDLRIDSGDNHVSFTSTISDKVRNLIKPFKSQRRHRKSFNHETNVRLRRSSNGSISIKSSEFSNSENHENFDLSFSIMPRESMRNLMSQQNLNPDLLDEVDEIEGVGLLAESRAPSFNVMLHANEIYSDTCTIMKRKTVRISWDDLANNTNIEEDEEISKDFVRDLGGRIVSEMRFNSLASAQGPSEVFGLRGLSSRGSTLVRMPSKNRIGANKGGVPLWSGTSTIDFNSAFDSFVLNEKTKDWLKSFKLCDPRHQILTFFNNVANEGATGEVDFDRDQVSPLLKYLYRSSVFTVWRPTSLDAIRRMMLGEGVGKGLDIKGKSAKRGKLSAFVPFLQIFQEEDKRKVRTLHKNQKIRIFFNSIRSRNIVMSNLNELAKELEETVRAAKQILDDEDKHSKYDEETIENAVQKMTLDMKDSTVDTIDTYASSNKYGIEVQERLFWEGMVMRQNIYRKPGSDDDIGRTSMPSFQDMNFSSLRHPRNSVPGGHTRAVIMQYNPPGEESNPMNPLNLLMAYEENDPGNNRRRVIPVVSDFDCFIVGTRGVRYEQEVPEDQVNILRWMIQRIEGVLDKPSNESWTKRWLGVLKEAGSKGFHPKIPNGGYSDPKTKFIFEHAIDRLGTTGAVRHGAECYNYYFPQELDEEFLVISDELPDEYNRCNWTYVKQDELKDILKYKIDKGYTFPLNPKWVLCDPGWKEVYDKLRLSDASNVQNSLNCFYPPESGITELIEAIYTDHPKGFQRVEDEELRLRINTSLNRTSGRLSQVDGTLAMDYAAQKLRTQFGSDGTSAMDLAEQELKYYFVLQRAKNRMRAYLKMTAMLKTIRVENSKSNTKKSGSNDEEKDSCHVEKEITRGDGNEEQNGSSVLVEEEIIDATENNGSNSLAAQNVDKEVVELQNETERDKIEGGNFSESNEIVKRVIEDEIKEDFVQVKSRRDGSFRTGRIETFEGFSVGNEASEKDTSSKNKKSRQDVFQEESEEEFIERKQPTRDRSSLIMSSRIETFDTF